jgi:hypothetical protein
MEAKADRNATVCFQENKTRTGMLLPCFQWKQACFYGSIDMEAAAFSWKHGDGSNRVFVEVAVGKQRYFPKSSLKARQKQLPVSSTAQRAAASPRKNCINPA